MSLNILRFHRLNYVRILVACMLVLALVPKTDIHADTEDFSELDTSVLFISEFLSSSLPLTKQHLDSTEDAKILSRINIEIFPLHLQNLRASNSTAADEIHLLLLDIHNGIGTVDAMQTISEIDKYENLLGMFEATNPDYGKAMALILTVVDEQYQIAVTDENQALYDLSLTLTDRAYALFPKTNYDTRLTEEIDSFLVELGQKIRDKDDFHSVGTLITAINRDLTGYQPLSYDKQKLYDTIRAIYVEMLESLDSGNYVAAEDLAVEAYLENFEYLEPDIEKVDPDLLFTLEWDMREVLRDMIKEGQDAAQIKMFVEETILPQLDTAESLVTQLGTSELAEVVPERILLERGDATSEEKSGVRSEIDFIRVTLQEVLVLYESGDYQAAYTSARTAYLDSYEYVEIPLRAIDPDFTLEVEFQFATLRNLINQQADIEEVREVAIAIEHNLDESERLVTGTGTLAPIIAFSSSFAIIFREGLESVLILGAILTYLEASRNTRFKKHVYYGVIAAIGATGLTWFVASYVIEISGANRELIEAIAALSATAMLFYVSFWVLNKIEHKKWMEFVKAKVWQATTTGSVMVFVMLAFFTVYREGFETVLFYQAISGFAKYMEGYVAVGFIAGMAVLFLIYYLMRKLGRRLPLRALFGLTMGVGAYMSIAFLGNAVRELQILDIVPYTAMFGTIPRLDINLATMTGIYPTLETVIAQIILLGIYLTASAYVLVVKPRKEQQLASMRKSHGDDNA